MEVSGTWSSPDWGIAILKQKENGITGTFGEYLVKGVASGNSLYLMMYLGDRAYYFAELKATDKDTFKGRYSDQTNRINDPGRPISLTKAASQ
jgi:hypothetical protein